jgi:hypothetical protein
VDFVRLAVSLGLVSLGRAGALKRATVRLARGRPFWMTSATILRRRLAVTVVLKAIRPRRPRARPSS